MVRIPADWGTHLPMGRDAHGDTLPAPVAQDTTPEQPCERAHWARLLPVASGSPSILTLMRFRGVLSVETAPVRNATALPRKPRRFPFLAPVPLCATTAPRVSTVRPSYDRSLLCTVGFNPVREGSGRGIG